MAAILESGGIDNMGADVTSDVADWSAARSGSVQVIIDNTDAVGTYYIQGSNDKSNWVDVSDGGVAVSSGTDANDLHDFNNPGFRWMRVFYDYTSGDGTIDAIEFHKLGNKG